MHPDISHLVLADDTFTFPATIFCLLLTNI